MTRSRTIQRIANKLPSSSSRGVTGIGVDSQSRPRRWPGLVAASTLMVGIATVLLHLLGMVVHRTYLAAWNISATQFPKSTDWLLLNGYYGIWNGFAMLFTTLVANFHWVAIGVVTLLIYIRLLTSPWDPFSYVGEKLSWLRRLPNWLRRLGLWVSVGTLISALLVPITLVLFLLIGVPAKMGKAIGEDIFENHFKEISKGCPVSTIRCIQVFKNGTLISTGFVLDVSTTHLAYFDIDLSRARVIPMDGLEMRALQAPKPHPAPAN